MTLQCLHRLMQAVAVLQPAGDHKWHDKADPASSETVRQRARYFRRQEGLSIQTRSTCHDGLTSTG